MKEFFESLYRAEAGRVRATLIRLLGDLDQADDAVSEAFAAAVEQWPAAGVPANPRAWLIATGRHKGVDARRRRARETPDPELLEAEPGPAAAGSDEEVDDDQLRLIFMCCHPELPPEAQVALTLREVCGLTTEEIARAFLTAPATVAQRIVRAKARLREQRVPFELPGAGELAARVEAALAVVYLVFNEGYRATSGPTLTRADLCGEALRLGRLLAALVPEPEVLGLVALMLLHESRRPARTGADGDPVLLADQDRSRWDRAAIAEGCALVERALRSLRGGRYALEAAIAAVHAEAASPGDTDWAQIVGLYDVLARAAPSPVVALNRAVALSMRDGPEAALPAVQALAAGELADYQPAHAALADLLRRAGRTGEARAAYRRALEATTSAPDRRFLERRLRELG